MRKFYFSLLGAMFALTVSAQDFSAQAGMKLDSVYSESADGVRMSKSVYEYDANGRIVTEYTYNYDFQGVNVVSMIKGVATYDDQGRLVREDVYESNGGDYVLSGYSENSEFDAENRPTVVTEYSIDDENPAAGIQLESKTVVSKYNGQNPEDYELYAWNGSDWDLYMTMHSDYNAQGLPVKSTQSMSVMGMTYTNTMTYEYDDHGQILRSETSSGFGIVTTADYTNTYDADGNLIKQVCSTMGTDVTMYLFWSKGGSAGLDRVMDSEKASAYYDLGGRRLNGQPTKKGIFIHNGKKVYNK